MKKILSILIAVILALSFSGISSAEETYTLSLEEAVELATKDNPMIESADVKIRDAQKQKEDAKREQKNIKGALRIPEAFSLVVVKQGYTVCQADFNLSAAKKEKEQQIAKLSYEVTQKYYSVKLAEALLKSTEKAYNLALENKKTMDAQFSLGMVSQLEVSSAEYGVNQAKAVLEKYKRDYDIAKRSLMITLQIDNPEAAIILTDGIDYSEFTSEPDKDIAEAMKTRFDVFQLESGVALAKKYRDITLVLGSRSAEYSAANQTVVQSEYTADNSKKLIGLGIRSAYNETQNASDSVLLAEENLAIKNQEYNIAKVQYELGMITNTQLTAALSNVTNAEIELENSKLTHKLSVIKYGYEITIGL